MNLDSANAERGRLNELMADHDSFFEEFARLDGDVYADGAIPKLYTELSGISISVFARCEECVAYHVQEALEAGATPDQLIEAIRIGVIGGGSVTYPTARQAFTIMEELAVLDE